MKQIEIKNIENTNSEILIESGLRKRLSDFFENKKYFLVTNDTIAKLYPEIVKNFEKKFVTIIPDGEKYKNAKTYNYIVENFLKNKIERKDCVIALGGGVVGDMAAYAASSVLRGVELIQVPTTLLSMCDSSIGGKTGYNTKYGKNLIGSFYFATKVLIDPEFLQTLNDYEFNCGMGEVVKYAFIEKSAMLNHDFNFLNMLLETPYENLKSKIDEIVYISASIKSNVVELDKKEGGLRKILNFGHTFAHAFETLSNYKKISHGEAVSMGMKCAFNLAYNIGKIDKTYLDNSINLLEKYDLIKNKFKFNKIKTIELMKQDKKVLDKKINVILPVGWSSVALFDDIKEPSFLDSLP